MTEYTLKTKSVGVLMNLVEQIAEAEFDGHYSIFSFTTNYRAAFGTIMDTWQFKSVEAFPTLKKALINAILHKPKW